MADDDTPYLIKRYSNRKLYDSVRRKFTTLDDVSKLLDAGVRILVRDHDTGIDRTDEILAQVLRRKAQSRPGSSFLADLLRTPADVAQSVVDQLASQGSSGTSSASRAAEGDADDIVDAEVVDDYVEGDVVDDYVEGDVVDDYVEGDVVDEPAEEAGDAAGARHADDAEAETRDRESDTADRDRSARQDEEIRELRDQVSQLTQAVTMLLQEKTKDADDSE
ncbi:hypothetical protein GCM10009624_27110 [Gordonia sinesedis]